MRQYWKTLNERQRWIFVAVSALAFLLLIYLCLLLPFKNSVTQLQNDVADKKDLAVWVNQYKGELKQLRRLQPIIKQQSSKTLLTLVEESMHKKPFSSSKADLQQTNPNEVQVVFNQIAFDVLVKWIDTLWQGYGIQLQQVTINPADKLGYVKVTALLSKAI